MKRFVAFLRGINVSGQRKVPMADLQNLLGNAGFQNVKTYIQSGNIVFESDIINPDEIAKLIQNSIHDKFGFEVPVLVKNAEELRSIIDANPYNKLEELEQKRLYFVLFLEVPNSKLVDAFKKEIYPNEEYTILKDCLYLKCNKGYGNAKLNNNLIERKLKIIATTRNYRTMNKLLQMAT
jgi:uncharacterized protein (DUF1697 family)